MASTESKRRKFLFRRKLSSKEKEMAKIETMQQYKKLSQEMRMYCIKQWEIFAPEYFKVKKPGNFDCLSEREKVTWERKAQDSLYYRKKEKKEEVLSKIKYVSHHLSRRTIRMVDELEQNLIWKI